MLTCREFSSDLLDLPDLPDLLGTAGVKVYIAY